MLTSRVMTPLFGLMLALLMMWPAGAQGLSDPALQAAVAAASAARPDLGRPTRWEFEILLPTNDSAMSCPLVAGVQTSISTTPIVVTLYYDEPYVVHVASDGSKAQPCDWKFPSMGVIPMPPPSAPDACTITPSGPYANVRATPDTEGVPLGTIEGDRPALGRNAEWTWYLVAEGWVAGTVVNATGNCLSNDLSIRDSQIAASLAPVMDEGAPAEALDSTPAALLPRPIVPDSATTCPPTGYMPPRLTTGAATAQIELGGLPNSIRSLPTTQSDRLGNIQPGRTIDFVHDGPLCGEGYVWWNVTVDGVRGWTAESNVADQSYYIQPTAGNAAPVTANSGGPTLISAENIAALQPVHTMTEPNAGAVWAGMANTFAYTATDAQGSTSANVAVYPVTEIVPLSTTVAGYAPITLQFGPRSSELYIGREDGRLYASSMDGRDHSVSFNAHEGAVTALAFSPDGTLLATASGRESDGADAWAVRLWDVARLSTAASDALVRSVRFPYAPVDVTFSADGRYLAVAGAKTSEPMGAGLWVYADSGRGENVETLGLPTPTVDVLPFVEAAGGAAFLYGRENALHRYDPTTGTDTPTYVAPPEVVVAWADASNDMLLVTLNEPTDTGGAVVALPLDTLDRELARWDVGPQRAALHPNGLALMMQTAEGTLTLYAPTG